MLCRTTACWRAWQPLNGPRLLTSRPAPRCSCGLCGWAGTRHHPGCGRPLLPARHQRAQPAAQRWGWAAGAALPGSRDGLVTPSGRRPSCRHQSRQAWLRLVTSHPCTPRDAAPPYRPPPPTHRPTSLQARRGPPSPWCWSTTLAAASSPSCPSLTRCPRTCSRRCGPRRSTSTWRVGRGGGGGALQCELGVEGWLREQQLRPAPYRVHPLGRRAGVWQVDRVCFLSVPSR